MSHQVPHAELVLYATEDGAARFFLRAEDGSVWLSQSELAALFQTSVPNINIHIRNVLDEGELSEVRTVRHAQDAKGQKLDCPSFAFPRPFHPDFSLMDQPGRTLVCRAHRKTDPSRHAPFHPPTRTGHPRLPCSLQRRSQTIRMDQIRRPNSRQRRTLLYANF